MDLTSIDPELRKQLAESSASAAVEATVTLATPPGHGFIPADEVGPRAREILDAVGRAVGEKHHAANIFENLGCFAVRARPAFLKALVERPEVVAAMANRQGEELLIRPVRVPKSRGPRD